MRPIHPLANRIRGEYHEMPGLRLTLTQACRLWQVDRAECQATLDALVAEGFLARTPDGVFMLPSSTTRVLLTPLKAGLGPARLRRGA